MTKKKIEVPVQAVEDIVAWWRAANEAPGGCSSLEAIRGMTDAVWELEMARREVERDGKT